MKATSRKRLLISSVAMLLVAMLALGTATFAWFTTDTNATASGLSFSTTKSSELLLSRVDLVWKDQIDYGMNNKALKPASSNNGTDWWMAIANAKTSYEANSAGFAAVAATGIGDKTANSNAGPTYVFDDMLNIKNNGQAPCTGVKITMNVSGLNSEAARIAVVPCASAQTTAGTRAAITAANFKSNIYGKTADRAWSAAKAAGAASTTTTETGFKIAAAANGKQFTVGTMNSGVVKSYRILVWFEGQDQALFDKTTDALAMPTVTFTVTGQT